MKKRLLSLISCALIACNIFSTISYAEEAIDSSIEVTEVVSEETDMTNVDTTEESDVEEPQTEATDSVAIEREELAKEDTDLDFEENVSQEETIVEDSKVTVEEEEESKDTYTVSFVDSVDDAIFAEYVLESGESVTDLPEAPTHEGYDFIEYNGNYTDVICDEEVIAVYEPIADENNLIFKELELDMERYLITVAGNMPKNTELYVKQIESKEAEEAIKTELDIAFEAQVSFDIKLMSDGIQYQPTEYDETVSVSIKGVNTTEELEVYRITDDGAVTDMSASNIDDTVKFDTDHFTTYTVGTAEYESLKTGKFLGLSYEYYDTDGDGKEDLIVVTGEQTTPYSVRYKDDIECDAYLKKYVHDSVYNLQGGRNRLTFSDYNEGTTNIPWKGDTITKCHFNDVKLLNAYELFKNCKNIEEIVLDNVDTSECFDMGELFYGCNNLSKLVITNPLDTRNVINMDRMFYDCWTLPTLDGEHNFNGASGLFTDTSKVKSFEWMFYDCYALESIDLTCIDGTSAETMESMFEISWSHQSKLKTLKLPDNLKLAQNVTKMFSDNLCLVGGFSTTNWDTSRVTTMEKMFYNCFVLKELDVSNWDTSSVTNISHMVDRCESIQLFDVSKWDVSKVTNMEGALSFLLEVSVLDVSNWDTSSCENMDSLFWGDEKVRSLDVSKWNVSKVTNMAQLFTGCKNVESLDLSNWDVSNVEEFGNNYSIKFLQYCDNLTVIDMFRTDVVKEEAGIPSVPSKDIGYHSVHGPNYMYIDDNKDGKADSVYEKYEVFKKDSVSHRYIFDDNPEYPEDSIDNLKSKYAFLYLIEPSDSPEAYGPHPDDVVYGKMIRKGPYLVENFEIVEARILDDSDPKNATGRAYLYTLNIDGDIVKALAGDSFMYPGADGTYGTEDDEVYWEIAPVKYYLWASYISDGYTLDEKYEMHKNYIKYKTNEVVTLSKEDWDYKVANNQELYYEASSFRLAKFRLTLQNEEGETLYSEYVEYEDDISSILEQYGSKWLDTAGNTVIVTTMPLESLTLRLGHTHVSAPAVKENVVEATEDAEGSYEEVVYCTHCHEELSRETRSIAKVEKNISETPSNNKDDSGKTTPENKPSDSGNNDSGNSSQPTDEDKVEPENKTEDKVEEYTEEKKEDIVDVADIGDNSNITVTSSNGVVGNNGEESLDYTVDIVASNDSSELHEVDLSSSNGKNNDISPKQAFIEKIVKAVVVTVGTTGATGGVLFVFIWLRRRKIKGKLVSRENLSYSNCLITLEGKDKLHTRTNKKGEFTFRNLKKGSYILNAFDEKDELLFHGEIFIGKEGKLNTIVNNGYGTHFEKVGETYFTDILA